MTRSAAFALARQCVEKTGTPYLVLRSTSKRMPLYEGGDYIAVSAYEATPAKHERVAWISVNGSERVYDGLAAPAAEEG